MSVLSFDQHPRFKINLPPTTHPARVALTKA